MKELTEKADQELGRLTDDMELEIQPFDPEYEERLRKWRAEATENGGTYTEAEEVLEKMLIYYDLTARIFTRNVITQVVERHLLLGMLRLFNPIEIMRLDNTVIEAIASENKETRDRRMALKQQKTAIEEARDICASLAMRSELRSYDDEPEDEVPTDDEDHYSTSRYSRQSAPYPSQAETSRKPVRESPPRPSVDNTRSRTPVTPQQESYPAKTNGTSRRENGHDWEQNGYAATSGPVDQPYHAPPPPPRPSKVGFEESERYHDAQPRPDTTYAHTPRTKESARQRLASAMRMNSQN
jgi:hypothetical protein